MSASSAYLEVPRSTELPRSESSLTERGRVRAKR